MNNEEFERKMSFIINQQAQFVADIQQLQATQAQTQNVVGQFANLTFEGFTYTLARFNDVNIKIDALVDSQAPMSRLEI